jgi:hypothetical protein
LCDPVVAHGQFVLGIDRGFVIEGKAHEPRSDERSPLDGSIARDLTFVT